MDTGALGALLGSVSRLCLVLSAVVAYLVIARLRLYYRLSQFKGPATAGISWWWHSKAVLSGQAQRYYGDVTEKYGGMMDSHCERKLLMSKVPLQEYRLST